MAPLLVSHYELMTADLTNLLPPHRKRFLAREYLFRLGVVVIWLFVVLALIHGLLLVPSYLYVHQQMGAREAQLVTLQTSQSGATEQELKTRVDTLQTRAKQLAALGTQPSASGAVRAVLAAPRPGIRIHGFTYAPAATATAHRMTINGTAATRESLRQYLQTLDALPYITTAELPISAYAEVKDIGFTITLTGSFLP